jgi:hypothetical protein
MPSKITTKSNDFNSYIIEARDSAIIKFDPLLVANLRKNNPAEWEFLNGPISESHLINKIVYNRIQSNCQRKK